MAGILTKRVYKQVFNLDGEGIDSFSEALEDYLLSAGISRQNIIRIRFSLEEALLKLQAKFGDENTFTFKIYESYSRRELLIEMEGDIYNPLSKTESGLENLSGALLTAVGLYPIYSYTRGMNMLKLSLPRQRMNSALKMLIAVFIGLAVGDMIHHFLPKTVQVFIQNDIFTPTFNFWTNLLTTISGPIVFLMVCSCVLSSSAIDEIGGNTRRLVIRYFILSLLASAAAVIVGDFVLMLASGGGLTANFSFTEYFAALMRVMPSDIVTPFMQSNTPQILLLAFTIGYGILHLGPSGSNLRHLVNEGNMLGLLVTEAVSSVVPYFAGFFLCMELIEGNYRTIKGIWPMIVISAFASLIVMLIAVLYVSIYKKISLKLIIRKVRPSFLAVLRHGNLDNGYGDMLDDCEKKLGMEKHFLSVSLPHGLILYMPINDIGTILFLIFAAQTYGIEITTGWLLSAVFLSVFVLVATPPVPGANLLAYIMIFGQLGIPSQVLVDAMIYDIIFGIFANAGNQLMLQMELILQSDRIGLLDAEKLSKE